MQSRAAVALIPRLAAILRLDRPAADSLSTSRTLRMGNLGSGIPRSYGKERSHADSRITQRRPSSPSTGCRDRPQSVVAIRQNAWSSSIGMTGRDQSESLVVTSRGAQRRGHASVDIALDRFEFLRPERMGYLPGPLVYRCDTCALIREYVSPAHQVAEPLPVTCASDGGHPGHDSRWR